MTKFNLFLIILSLSLFSCGGEKKSSSNNGKGNETTQNVKREVPEMTPSTKPVKRVSPKEGASITESITGAQYHIIAASYNIKSQAEVFKKQLYRKGYPSKVLYSKGKYRVTLVSFSQKEKAIKELKRLRELNQKPDLWLLKQ